MQYIAIFVIYFIGIIISTLLHEFGHYIAYKRYDADPKFGCKRIKTKIMPYITPIEGEDFYWKLFKKDENNAWKKMFTISAAGLGVTLIIGLICLTKKSSRKPTTSVVGMKA